jgi:cell wall-associated NlpC family hydrolase
LRETILAGNLRIFRRMKIFFRVMPFVLLGCTVRQPSSHTALMQSYADAVRVQYAPDGRTALFQASVHGQVISGETNLPEAKISLLRKLDSAGISYVDSLHLLPQEALEGKHYGVVTLSVANLRTQPRHPAELATQATLGTPLKIWKRERGWYLVQTPDRYIAWLDAGGLELMDSATFAHWKGKKKIIYTKPFGFAYQTLASDSTPVSDLVYGDVLELAGEESGSYKVNFPDGRTAYIHSSEAMPLGQWSSSRQPGEENLVQTARKLVGLPYLWGGTSMKGVDCSGFTRTIYFMNGLLLPRDASQQVNIGEEVDTRGGWAQLRPGDLLFFGAPAREGRPERVVHVGMWIGGGEFIHSSGRVQVASLIPGTANYDEQEHRRFLRARRVSPSSAIADLRQNNLW